MHFKFIRTSTRKNCLALTISCLVLLLSSTLLQDAWAAETLKLHGIFRNNMILQRDKPITIWGWAPVGTEVKVTFGEQTGTGKARENNGRWEVVFTAQPANTNPQSIKISSGDASIQLENILIGDIWVMNGQSNMAFSLKAVYQSQFEASMAHLPLMRHIRINSGAESENIETDLKDQFINGTDEDKNWRVVTPEVALEMGAIGYVFGSRLQRSLQIPIGIIDNARGGASLESLVPRHKFSDHPMATEYLKWVDERHAAFSEEEFLNAQMEKWKVANEKYEQQVAEDKVKGRKVNRRKPNKPDGSIRTWSVPGRSPSDAASCYNGMFGVFKGLNIKGVAFHQGYNNAMQNGVCKPKFYRILMKLMVEGWREDFQDPKLPVAVIGFCAGGQAQTRLNFEEQGVSTAAYIREAQRLGLADVNDPEHTVFIPSYDQKIPQLHTKKKVELGVRTARWALKTVYGKQEIVWDTARLLATDIEGDKILLTFDKPVVPDDFGSEIEGFSIADESGTFYMAQAIYVETKERAEKHRKILVSSPLVSQPVAVRYAWARSPMGNLKVNGMPWQPLHNFRTDDIDLAGVAPHSNPEAGNLAREAFKELKLQATTALETRLNSTAEKK